MLTCQNVLITMWTDLQGHKQMGCQGVTVSALSCSVSIRSMVRYQELRFYWTDRIPSTTPGEEPPRDVGDSGPARSHSMHLETSSSDRP